MGKKGCVGLELGRFKDAAAYFKVVRVASERAEAFCEVGENADKWRDLRKNRKGLEVECVSWKASNDSKRPHHTCGTSIRSP